MQADEQRLHLAPLEGYNATNPPGCLVRPALASQAAQACRPPPSAVQPADRASPARQAARWLDVASERKGLFRRQSKGSAAPTCGVTLNLRLAGRALAE